MTENEAVAKLKAHIKRDEILREGTVVIFTDTLRDVVAYVEELEAKVPAEPERAFKVGDKVQEVTDEEEKPWGYVIETRELGQFVKLENTRHAGRKLLYYDDEIVAFAEPSKFTTGQKVRELSSGQIGTILFEHSGYWEVLFQQNYGSVSRTFEPDQLEAV